MDPKKQRNKFSIEFNGDFYKFSGIQKTADIFQDVAECKISRQGRRIRVAMKSKGGGEAQKMADEFRNYALFLSLKGQV